MPGFAAHMMGDNRIKKYQIFLHTTTRILEHYSEVAQKYTVRQKFVDRDDLLS